MLRRRSSDQPGRRPTCAGAPAPARCSARSRSTCRRATLRTRAVWWTVDRRPLDGAGVDRGATCRAPLHAAEHAAIGLLPLFATCDRWDIGGVSTALHPDTGAPTVFVYDGHPGGAGFAERGYRDGARPGWRATRDAIAACECERAARPASSRPSAATATTPLDKTGAVRVLDLVLRAIGGEVRER